MLTHRPFGRQIIVLNDGPEMAWKVQLWILRDAEYRDQPLEMQTQPIALPMQVGDLMPGKQSDLPLSFVAETRFPRRAQVLDGDCTRTCTRFRRSPS